MSTTTTTTTTMRWVTRSSKGYTLVEMLVVVAIIGIIFPAMMQLIVTLYRSHSDTFARSAALTEVTTASKEIVRDIRSAMQSEAGALPIVTTGTDALTIYADTDLDGRIERVRYYVSGRDLMKGVIEPTAVPDYPTGSETVTELAAGIVNAEVGVPVFRYFDAESNEIAAGTDLLSIRRITVELAAESALGRQSRDVRVRSSASIRNLKDQY